MNAGKPRVPSVEMQVRTALDLFFFAVSKTGVLGRGRDIQAPEERALTVKRGARYFGRVADTFSLFKGGLRPDRRRYSITNKRSFASTLSPTLASFFVTLPSRGA